jgi:hypothetical protein
MIKTVLAAGAAAIALAAMSAAAQTPVAETPLQAAPGALPADEAAANAEAAVDPDNMADQLNARQQVRQSFTFTRTVNGEVVETKQEEIAYSRSDPVRSTEAKASAFDALKAKFDREVLSRTEAFEEAKLDFVVADADHDGKMTEAEFQRLVRTWRNERDDASGDAQTARERQYRAFLDELEGTEAGGESAGEAKARQKFAFMAGAAQTVGREDFIREYLVDFDAMDANGDMILRGDELLKFRALNRGDNLGM